MLQTQLGVLGKVFPVMLPERIVDMAHGMSLKSTASLMMSASLTRVQEVSVVMLECCCVDLGCNITSAVCLCCVYLLTRFGCLLVLVIS